MNYPNNTYNDSKSIKKNGQSYEIISDEFSIPVDKINCSFSIKNMDLVSQIKFYTQEHDYKRAIELCDSEEGKNRIIIQSRKVNLLLKMFRESNNICFLEEALKTCDKYVGSEIFDSHRNKIYNILKRVYIYKEDFEQSELNLLIRKLIDNKNMSLALGFCDLLDDFSDEELDLMKLEILMLKFNDNNDNIYLQKANSICVKYIGNEKFDDIKNQIDLYLNDSVLLTELLGKIYYGIIDVIEIENSDIDIWKKQLLMISYYEKNNKKKGQIYIKSIKNDYIDDPNKLKILNILNERMISKKIKIFDISVYSAYLYCKLDFDIFDSVLKSYKESLIQETTIIKPSKSISESIISTKKNKTNKDNKRIISCSGTSVNRYNQHNVVNNNVSINIQPIDRKVLIKDVYSEEIYEICLYLYVKMNELNNKQAIKAWDNFENLIYKPICDKAALARMDLILKKMIESGIVTNSISDGRVKKYLK